MRCKWAGCPGSQAEAILCVHLERACGHAPGAGRRRGSGGPELLRRHNNCVPSCDACTARVRATGDVRQTECPWCHEVNAPLVVRVHDLVEAVC